MSVSILGAFANGLIFIFVLCIFGPVVCNLTGLSTLSVASEIKLNWALSFVSGQS